MPAELLMFFAFFSFVFWIISGLVSFCEMNSYSKGGDAGRFSFVCSVIFALATTWLSFGNANRGYKDYEVHVKVVNEKAYVNEDMERFDGINLNSQFHQQFHDGEIITIREHDVESNGVHFERRLELVENTEEKND